MAQRSRPITAAELASQLRNDPEWVRAERERQRDHVERAFRYRAEQSPIVDDLHAAGVRVETLWDLMRLPTPGPAVRILLKHLSLAYSEATLETIARALADPAAKDAWPFLAAAYRRAPSDGLATALAATVTPNVLSELICLAKDPTLGPSRGILFGKLRRLRSRAAKQAVDDLESDPLLGRIVSSWKEERRQARGRSKSRQASRH